MGNSFCLNKEFDSLRETDVLFPFGYNDFPQQARIVIYMFLIFKRPVPDIDRLYHINITFCMCGGVYVSAPVAVCMWLSV